jgi:pimeloyl-ACP methyl ester carboxylesterase
MRNGAISARDLAYINQPLNGQMRLQDSTVRFSSGLSEGALSFRGTLSDTSIIGQVSEIGIVKGRFAPVGDTARFSMRRARVDVKETGYDLKDVTFSTNGVRLAGTLFMPKHHAGEKLPAAVFVHGSGPSLRSEGYFLADHLARHGIACLVYDKRGVGESGGDWTNATVDDLAQDAISGIATLEQISEIDARRVGLIGVSQAGWVVLHAAATSSKVGFVVLQAGPVLAPTVNATWRFELRIGENGITGSDSVRAIDFIRRDNQVSQSGVGLAELRRDADAVRDSIWFRALGWSPDTLINSPFRRWSRAINSYEPRPDLLAIKVPGIWFFGDRDRAVNGRLEAAALCAARAGRPGDISVYELANADHGMRIDRPETGEFPRHDPAFFDKLDAWLDTRITHAKAVSPQTGCRR